MGRLCMKLNWKFLGGGGGVQNKKNFRGGSMVIFSSTAQLLYMHKSK